MTIDLHIRTPSSHKDELLSFVTELPRVDPNPNPNGNGNSSIGKCEWTNALLF